MAIDLTDPNLPEHLLADRTDRIALEVFERRYLNALLGAPNFDKVFGWIYSSLAPVEAIHLAFPAARQAFRMVSSKSALKAGLTPKQAGTLSEILGDISDSLARGGFPRKRGRPPELKRKAVIAFVLKHHTSLKWPEIADRLFVVNGACTRCKLPKHAYHAGSVDDFKTPCVNVLLNEYNLLKKDLAKQKIPLPQSHQKSRTEH